MRLTIIALVLLSCDAGGGASGDASADGRQDAGCGAPSGFAGGGTGGGVVGTGGIAAGGSGVDRAPWPMFQQNPRHTGRSAFRGAQTATKKWAYQTGHEVYSSPVVGADGTIYIGSDDYNLHAIASDGTRKWVFGPPFEDPGNVPFVRSAPAIAADGTIYFSRELPVGRFYAINPDGSQKWAVEAGSRVGAASVTIGDDGTVYFAAGSVHALNPDGTKKWVAAGGSEDASPAVDADGTVYQGGAYSTFAFDRTGNLKWSFGRGANLASPSVGADGAIYIAGSSIYAINPDGTEKWTFRPSPTTLPPFGFGASTAIASDGTIYVGASYGLVCGAKNFFAIGSDGNLKWEITLGRGVIVSPSFYSTPAIDVDGTIYVGSDDGNLYAVSPDGRPIWAFATGGAVYSSPAIGADGTVYVGSLDGSVYAVGS